MNGSLLEKREFLYSQTVFSFFAGGSGSGSPGHGHGKCPVPVDHINIREVGLFESWQLIGEFPVLVPGRLHVKKRAFHHRSPEYLKSKKRLRAFSFKRLKLGLERPVHEIYLAGICNFAIDRQRVTAGEAARTEILAVKADGFHEGIE